MILDEIMTQEDVKKNDIKKIIIDGMVYGSISSKDIFESAKISGEKSASAVLESIEEVSNKKFIPLGIEYFDFAKKYVESPDDECKREASRIVGNMAASFPDELDDIIPVLIRNSEDPGTAVRWGSAYALSRIIVLEKYRSSDLCDKVKGICDAEKEIEVKNQYLSGLERIEKV